MSFGPATQNGVGAGLVSVPTLRASKPYASLNLDFVNSTSLDSRVTFTRASTATYFNSSGVLSTAATNTPRFDYNPTTLAARGLLIEEARTNSIRNNTMQGAAAGTPGTLPTNWSGITALTGLTQQIVGTGTESGITYIDIRLYGTPSAAGVYRYYFETVTAIAALTAQTWANSYFIKLAAGSLTGVNSFTDIYQEFTSGGAYITEAGVTAAIPTSMGLASQRNFTTRTLAGGVTTAFLRTGLQLGLSGAAVDITLRIGLPQLELGAFATSVISTMTSSVSRAADVATMTGTNFSSWYNQNQGTLLSEITLRQTNPTAAQIIASINDNTANNRWGYGLSAASNLAITLRNTAGAGAVFENTANAATVNAISKIALAISTGASLAMNGGTVVTSTTYAAPTVTQMNIGNQLLGNYFNGWIRRITYYPTRVTNNMLQILTT